MKKGKPRNYEGFEGALNEIAMFYNFGRKVSFKKLEDYYHISRTVLPMCVELGVLIKDDEGKYRLVKPYSKDLADNVYDSVVEKYRTKKPPTNPDDYVLIGGGGVEMNGDVCGFKIIGDKRLLGKYAIMIYPK